MSASTARAEANPRIEAGLIEECPEKVLNGRNIYHFDDVTWLRQWAFSITCQLCIIGQKVIKSNVRYFSGTILVLCSTLKIIPKKIKALFTRRCLGHSQLAPWCSVGPCKGQGVTRRGNIFKGSPGCCRFL
jgi:hypothetical protein